MGRERARGAPGDHPGGEFREGQYDLRGGPVVDLQPPAPRSREIPRPETRHVERGRAPEAVDGLLRVAHRPEVPAIGSQCGEKPDAAPVHVLVLVDDHVVVTFPQVRPDGVVPLEQHHRQVHQVAEVDAVGTPLDPLVDRIDAGDLGRALGRLAGGHGIRECRVLRGAHRLVLGPRDGRQDVRDDAGGIVDVPVVPEPEARELVLEKLHRFGPVDQGGVRGQSQFGVETADEVEAEGVEGSDPHRRRRVGPVPGDPVGHLVGGLVREGEDQDAAGIDAVVEQSPHPARERLGLPGPRTGLQQVGRAAVAGRVGLQRVQGPVGPVLFGSGLRRREQQGVEELLGDDVERRAEPGGDLRCGHSPLDVQPPRHRSREQELAGEKVHLDFAALPPAIVDHPLRADRRRLRGPRRIRDRSGALDGPVAQLRVSDLVRHQERLLERRSGVLVDDQINVRDQDRPSSVEDRGAGPGALDVEAPPVRLGDGEGIGVPRVGPRRDGLRVKPRRDLPCEFDAVQLTPPSVRPASPRKRPLPPARVRTSPPPRSRAFHRT